MKDITNTVLVFLLIAGFFAFWIYNKSKNKKNKNEPGLVEIQCDECNGLGKVTYDKDHLMVTSNFAEPGTYTCSMCSGSGKLLLDNRK